MSTTTPTGYVNGSDMLLLIDGKAVGHCTTHSVSITTETKERAVKPVATVATAGVGLWKQKGVTGVAVSISAEGLHVYDETEGGLMTLAGVITEGTVVTVNCIYRSKDTAPYLSGNFVITKLDHSMPGQDDVSYSIELENSGPVTFDDTVFTGQA